MHPGGDDAGASLDVRSTKAPHSDQLTQPQAKIVPLPRLPVKCIWSLTGTFVDCGSCLRRAGAISGRPTANSACVDRLRRRSIVSRVNLGWRHLSEH